MLASDAAKIWDVSHAHKICAFPDLDGTLKTFFTLVSVFIEVHTASVISTLCVPLLQVLYPHSSLKLRPKKVVSYIGWEELQNDIILF